MNWTTDPWLGFDTETTGVDIETDRIVTAALVRRPGGAEPTGPDETTTWLADPGVPIPERASAIHGITTERAQAEGRPIVEVLDEVATQLVAQWAQGYPVVVFNAAYDIPLLNNELTRHSLGSLEERLGDDIGPVIDPLVIDRKLDRFRKGKKNLGAMVGAYGVALQQDAHTAEVDVQMTLDVLAGMVRRFPELDDMDASTLQAWQAQAHREWADDFESWLRSRGRPATISRAWPQ